MDGDFLTALLAESILRKEPGATILYDVRASRARCATSSSVPAGSAEVNRVGTRSSRPAMREEGAAFGGEVSGHYYFRDFYCADSGTIPALLILELLSVEGKPHERAAGAAARALLHLGGDQLRGLDQDGKMKEIAERLLGRRDHWLDGVSVDYDDWHFNVRPSNTEPLLRLNLSLSCHANTWR